MNTPVFPTIDLCETGRNIVRLRKKCGLSVRDVQHFFGFVEPQAVYKWQQGKSLPSVDNLFALSILFGVPMDEILVRTVDKNLINEKNNGQSKDCPSRFAGAGVRLQASSGELYCLTKVFAAIGINE